HAAVQERRELVAGRVVAQEPQRAVPRAGDDRAMEQSAAEVAERRRTARAGREVHEELSRDAVQEVEGVAALEAQHARGARRVRRHRWRACAFHAARLSARRSWRNPRADARFARPVTAEARSMPSTITAESLAELLET